MKEDVPWKKGATCWKNSEHPSVRIKDKVSHWPRFLGDLSPSKTRAVFILKRSFLSKTVRFSLHDGTHQLCQT